MSVIYLIGSLRNREVPVVGEYLRKETGHEIFDEWWTGSEDADDWLRDYFKFRKLGYKEAIHSYAARNTFEFDKKHLNRADCAVLVMPAGKSGHLELGYIIGQGKPGFILFDAEPERVDIMHNFANDVFFNKEDLVKAIKDVKLG